MFTGYCLFYTVYSHDLNDPSKSFSRYLTLEDFNRKHKFWFKKAVKVRYVNPKGEEYLIKYYNKKATKFDEMFEEF